MKIVLESVLTEESIKREDGGMAIISEVAPVNDDAFFVRLQSWSEDKQHTTMGRLIGKRVRVTVEVVDLESHP